MQVRGFSGASLKQGRVRNAAAASLAVRAWLQWRRAKKRGALLQVMSEIALCRLYKPILN